MRIGFAAQNPTSHYWLIVNYGVQERAAELGIDLLLQPSFSLAEQISVIEQFIEQQVDALLIGPTLANGLADVVTRAQNAGIPVITLATQLNDKPVDCVIQSNHRFGAERAAAFVASQLQGQGEVAHLIGPRRLYDNVERALGMQGVWAEYPNLRIVAEEESPDWSWDSGKSFAARALQANPELRAICAANDTLALGVLAAIEEAGKGGQVLLTGFDGSPDALTAIYEQRMSATVRQSTRKIGQVGVDVAQRLANGEKVPAMFLIETSLITRDNLLDAALETAYILPSLLRDAVNHMQQLAKAQQEIINGRDEMIRVQEAALRELSSPLVPISDTVMALPLVGNIDSTRSQQILETLLQGVSSTSARQVIIDITGVPVVDTQAANSIIHAAQAVKLLGAQVILTGIRPEVAQALVSLGVDLSSIVTRSTLQSGIAYTLRLGK